MMIPRFFWPKPDGDWHVMIGDFDTSSGNTQLDGHRRPQRKWVQVSYKDLNRYAKKERVKNEGVAYARALGKIVATEIICSETDVTTAPDEDFGKRPYYCLRKEGKCVPFKLGFDRKWKLK